MVRLYYPVDVTEVASSLSKPLGVEFKDGIVYVAEQSEGCLSFMDVTGKRIFDSAKLTAKETRKVLEDLILLPAKHNKNEEKRTCSYPGRLDHKTRSTWQHRRG